MSGIGIDWRSADVRDGRLTVAFTEKPPNDWIERLERVVERLHRGNTGWQSIEVKTTKLKVDAVAPGSEADLRHFLDSALLQTNAEVFPIADQGRNTTLKAPSCFFWNIS